MGRRSVPSNTLAARVRAHYGLKQAELGAYLGVTPGQVAHVEAGRHLFSPAAEAALLQLAAPLFAAETEAEAPVPEPARAPLEARLDRCRHEAAKLRRALHAFDAHTRLARRWAAALPAVVASLPPADPRYQRRRAWLERHTPCSTPADVAHYHLLRLRAEALEAEAAGLAALLAAGPAEPA